MRIGASRRRYIVRGKGERFLASPLKSLQFFQTVLVFGTRATTVLGGKRRAIKVTGGVFLVECSGRLRTDQTFTSHGVLDDTRGSCRGFLGSKRPLRYYSTGDRRVKRNED